MKRELTVTKPHIFVKTKELDLHFRLINVAILINVMMVVFILEFVVIVDLLFD